MNLPTNFKAGQLVKASEWDKIASEVNRIWAMETDANFELTKGEPWRIRYRGASVAANFNGPVWEIYVWRPTATHSFDTEEAPEAVYITGPFTANGSTETLRIAKLQATGLRKTELDSSFSVNCGFLEAPTYFRQRLARCFDDDTLVVACGAGITFKDASNGLFFQVETASGNLAHTPPWAGPESVIPNITTDGTITGIASYGDTIAISLGVSNSPAGLVLFQTDGSILEAVAGSGTWIRQDGLASSYYSIIADADSYVYTVQWGIGYPSPQGIKKINASVATGMTDDAVWYSNAGTGGATEGYAPTISSSSLILHAGLDEWNGLINSSPIAQIQNSPFPQQGIPVNPSDLGVPNVPAISNVILLCESHVTDTIVFLAALNPETLYILRTDTGVLTTLSGFNDAVSDVKFFRLKDDLVTEQYIVAGDFTTYNGESAPYLIFIDQNGTRLADLEWP